MNQPPVSEPLLCDMQPAGADEQFCTRCGWGINVARFPVKKVYRQCSAVDFDALDTRGLGDAIATATRAFGIPQPRRCRCAQRQRQANQWAPFAEERIVQLPAPRRPLVRALRGLCRACGLVKEGLPKVMLLKLPYGFGDAVQLSSVVRQIQHHRPDWVIDLVVPEGCETMFDGVARQTFPYDHEPSGDGYRINRELVWDEPDPVYADSPSTKIERSLREQFHLPPVPELSRYCCTIRAGDREHAAALLAPIPRPRLLLHYQGASVRENKTLDEQVARSIIEQAQGAGWSVILHDFGQSKLVDLPGVRNFGAGHPLWQGHRYGHGSMMIALSSLCDYHVDIDSGPGHCLACTDTPGAIVWTRHHPLHFYCLAPNVLHLVPQSHERYIRGYCDEDVEIGARYFREHYRALYYRHQRVDLPDLVLHQLKRVEPKERLCQLPSASPR